MNSIKNFSISNIFLLFFGLTSIITVVGMDKPKLSLKTPLTGGDRFFVPKTTRVLVSSAALLDGKTQNIIKVPCCTDDTFNSTDLIIAISQKSGFPVDRLKVFVYPSDKRIHDNEIFPVKPINVDRVDFIVSVIPRR